MAFLSQQVPISDKNGYVTPPWFGFFQDILKSLTRAAGENVFTVATQPTLGPADAGYIGLVTDYGHLVRWTGSAWEFVPGDAGNGYLVSFVVAPTAAGWGLCDGSTYSYLVVGATLTTADYMTASIADAYFRR